MTTRSRLLLWIGIAVAALVLVVVLGLVFGGWWLTSGRYSPVPSVDGLTLTAATRVLHQAGFAVRIMILSTAETDRPCPREIDGHTVH